MPSYRPQEVLRNLSETGRRNWYVGGYFTLLLLVGLFLYKDYGVSWDESIDRTNGLVNAKYMLGYVAPDWVAKQPVLTNVPSFYGHSEIDHGALFHLPLAFYEIFKGGIDSRAYYLLRHFCTFLTFVLGTWAMYNLGRIRFRSWQWGLLASTLLVLSPRIFADAFYNGKDLVFMALFTLAIYTLVRLLERPTLGRAVLHGLATAAATDVRILGCMLFALSIGMFALEALLAPGTKKSRWLLLQVVLVYCVATWVFTVAGWPYLWEDSVASFAQAFDNMQRFRWEGTLLYIGDMVLATELPWHYAPVWIAISTPVAYTLAFVVGSLSYVFLLLRRGLAPLRTFEGRLDLLFSGWFVIPIFMVVALHSIIYDGWRHLYFIYPAMLLLAVRGIYAVWQLSQPRPALRRVALAVAVLAGMEGAYTLGRMVTSHPHQQIYFSFLPAHKAEALFERDYWGLSYREGLEWILAHDSAPILHVNNGAFPIVLENNLAILKPEDRARFQITSDPKDLYYFAGYRTHPEPYPDSLGREVHALRVNGIKILSLLHK